MSSPQVTVRIHAPTREVETKLPSLRRNCGLPSGWLTEATVSNSPAVSPPWLFVTTTSAPGTMPDADGPVCGSRRPGGQVGQSEVEVDETPNCWCGSVQVPWSKAYRSSPCRRKGSRCRFHPRESFTPVAIITLALRSLLAPSPS